ncbi:MAG: hypothetical protein ACRD3T_16985 [Terriglobia bacterium]
MEVVVRGRPSRFRFAEWQAANSVPAEDLPELSEEQKAHAKQLRIPEQAYRIALKGGELARRHAIEKLEYVERLIAEAAKRAGVDITDVEWDFVNHQFSFIYSVNGRWGQPSLPPQAVDDYLLDKEGAGERLKEIVDLLLGGLAK